MESIKLIFAKVTSYFMRGLLFVAPIGVTFYILFSFFNQIDSILQIKIPISAKNEMILPGLGFLIIILSTALVGFVSSVWFPNTFLSFFENSIRKLPVVRIVYFSLKDLVSAFVGDKKKFDSPVLVLVDEANQIHKIGFITQKDLSQFGIENKMMVYFPQSYAFAGDLIIIDACKVTEMAISAAEAMKLIVSGGISSTD